MNRIAVGLAVCIVSLLTMGPSQGTDLVQPRPYVKAPIYRPYSTPAFTWQGFYVGFNGGYGWSDSTLSGATGTSTVHPSGALLGSTAGYNFQTAKLVYGIEGDIDYSWMRDTNAAVAPCASCEVQNRYLATLRGRLGYAWDRWLPYITGGAAFGNIKISTPAGGSQTQNKVGWTVGGGVEYAFPASHWSTKIEYLYADLGSAKCDAAYCGTQTSANLHANVIRVGINYKY
jgi:outer membrane immunogenic protein